LSSRVLTISRNRVRVTVMAVKKLTATPTKSVSANPVIVVAPEYCPNP
jgi:hypothetical protein